MRATLAVLLNLLGMAGAAHAQLIINEIEYDQPAADRGEFIELANVGSTPIELGEWAIVLVNGVASPPGAYRTITLPPGTLAPGGFFVVCGNAANVPGCQLEASPDQD